MATGTGVRAVTRAHIGLKTKLASALLALGLIPYEDAKAMGEANFLSLFTWDHGSLHAFGGTDAFYNLTPRLIQEHRAKSRKDTGIVAKSVRITKQQENFRRRMLAKDAGDPKPKSRWPSRPFPKKRMRVSP